jgi:hypothetical protein
MTTTSQDTKQDDPSAPEWMEVVIGKIRNLRYGSVQITVHDGRVTLVESIEKTRFASDSPQPPKNR